VVIKPNGYITFKKELTEKRIDCHVKISGPMYVWYSNNNTAFIPSFSSISKYKWFTELENNHGKLVGLFHKDKVVILGQEGEENRPDW